MEEGECLIDGWDEPKIKAIMAQAKKDTIEAKNGDKYRDRLIHVARVL